MRLGLCFAAATLALIPHTASAEPLTAGCTVREVAVFTDRVHVLCSASATATFGGLREAYFSVEANSPIANGLVTLASQAVASQRRILITFDSSTGANPAGCLARDCRRVLSVRGLID